MLTVALVLFGGTMFVAIKHLPPLDLSERWWCLLIVAFVGVPASLAVNAAEVKVSAAIAGSSITLKRALEVSTLATAANLLPLPGSVLVEPLQPRQPRPDVGTIVGAGPTRFGTIELSSLAVFSRSG